MSHFAFFIPPYAGHLNPALALAAALRRRGHATTLVGPLDLRARAEAAGIDFAPIGLVSHPPGTVARMADHLASTAGLAGLGRVITDMVALTEAFCRDGERLLPDLGASAIVADQMEPAGGLLARRFGLPQVSLANALLVNRDPMVPPPFTAWSYDPSAWGRWRNEGGYRVSDLLMRPIGRQIAAWAQRWSLGPLHRLDDCLSPDLQISQMLAGLDFPRSPLPAGLHYVGPLREAGAAREPRPQARRVFCSLGTLQGGRFGIFRLVAEACRDLGLDLVIAHGGRMSREEEARLPGRPRVAAFLDQRAELAEAGVAVTHGGLNTVLDALSLGVPLLTIPIAFEQAAIGARIARSGAGLRLDRRLLSRRVLRDSLSRMLGEERFQLAADMFAREAASAGGAETAARLVEAHVDRTAARPPLLHTA